MTTSRTLYRNRPNWTNYITYRNGTREAFLHCGFCMSIIPTGEIKCRHCGPRLAAQKERFEAFLKSKEEEGIS